MFCERLRSDAQVGVVGLLMENPNGLTDAQLCSQLSMKGNQELAGVIAGIVKNITAAGLRADEVLIRRANKRNGRRSYWYGLTARAHAVLVPAPTRREPAGERETSMAMGEAEVMNDVDLDLDWHRELGGEEELIAGADEDEGF